MEKYILEQDIPLICVRATSFPGGIAPAHNSIRRLFHDGRKFFALSRPEKGKEIIYWAAAEERATGEAGQYGLEKLVVRKGTYYRIMVKDFITNVAQISQAYQQICAQPDIDPQSYCVETYDNETDLSCMVRIID